LSASQGYHHYYYRNLLEMQLPETMLQFLISN